jgi:hypothetical protein
MRWICEVTYDSWTAHCRRPVSSSTAASRTAAAASGVCATSPYFSFDIINAKWATHKGVFFRAQHEARARRSFAQAASPAGAGAGASTSGLKHWTKLPLQADLKPNDDMRAMAKSVGFTGADAWRRAVNAFDKKPGSTYDPGHAQYRKCAFKYAFPKVSSTCKAKVCARCSAKRDFDNKVPLPAGA